MKQKAYTLGEEIFSSVTHGVGTLLSVGGTVVLIVAAAMFGDALTVVSVTVFGASMIILYCMSTLYHAITHPKAKRFFRVMDHNTIFFLIAGTYTPITLTILRGALGWTLFLRGLLHRHGLGHCDRHPSAARKNGRPLPVAAGRRRHFLYGRRHFLRHQKGAVLSLRLAYLCADGQPVPLPEHSLCHSSLILSSRHKTDRSRLTPVRFIFLPAPSQ